EQRRCIWRTLTLASNGLDQEEYSVMSGTSDKIKGRVKEAVGALTDDQRLNAHRRFQSFERLRDLIKCN
ncbi:MAG: hypothetical protein ABSC37_19030, partial [Xanthobacteraceae bacterium]